MKKKYFRFSFLVVVMAVFFSNLYSQQSVRFFEPGISITYDTATVSVYKKDASIFRIKAEQIEIRVNSEMPGSAPGGDSKKPATVSELQAYVQNQVVKLKKQPGSFSFTDLDVVDYDKKVQKVGDFIGYGFVELNKAKNKKYTTIFCFHISENTYTTITVKSFENKPLAQHYKQLESFLKGFKSYTKTELSDHVKMNEKKYRIVVSETKEIMPAFKNRTGAYLAIVSTKEKLENKVKEVFLSSDAGLMAEVFEPNEKGEVYIACGGNKKGMIKRKAEFVFFSSIGKEIRIPFVVQFERK